MASTGPFATGDDSEAYGHADFHLRAKKCEVAEKAGSQTFDKAVYMQNRAGTLQQQAQSKARNGAAGAAPYSLHNLTPTSAYGDKEHHMQHLHKELPDKIGTSGTFDADAYRQQVAANAALQQQLKHQKHGSAAESGVGGNSGSSCPFATFSSAECLETYERANYKAKPQHRDGADKVGAGRTFDPTTYSANIAANRQQQAESTKRSFVGSGDILAFPATPGSGTAAAKQP